MRAICKLLVLVLALVLLATGSARALCDLTGLPPGSEVVELTTPLGTICIQLLRADAPLHVDNFLHYVDSGALAGTFFHRSVPGFIVQGGGYVVGSSDYEAIPATNGTVTNEPCTLDTPDPLNPGGQICSQRGNERGTVALAKVGGDPDSGSTNWFINLADNRSNLDNQNGGFTVFGRVLGDGMAVVDAMAALPTASQDDLAWMESALQVSSGFPFPLLEAPLDTAGDGVGCWNPASQTTAIDDTQLPALVGLGPDPDNPTIPFATFSTTCSTFLADPADFVGPGGCPGDLLTIRTTGPRSLAFPGSVLSYYSISCAAWQQTLVDRAVWQAAFQAHFNQQLVTIDAVTVHATPAPALPGTAWVLLAAGLAASGTFLGTRVRGPSTR